MPHLLEQHPKATLLGALVPKSLWNKQVRRLHLRSIMPLRQRLVLEKTALLLLAPDLDRANHGNKNEGIIGTEPGGTVAYLHLLLTRYVMPCIDMHLSSMDRFGA